MPNKSLDQTFRERQTLTMTETNTCRPFPFDAAEVARIIDIPLEAWPGRCHAIADAIRVHLPVEGMRLMRGHWTGPAHKDSIFSGGIQQHSWLELADGRVLDPTRWTFLSPSEPAIYLGPSDHYDFAGLGVNQAQSRGLPLAALASNPFVAIIEGYSETDRAEFARLLGRSADAGAQALANSFGYIRTEHPEKVENAAEIYRFAKDHGLWSFLPIDCRILVLEPEKITAQSQDGIWYTLPTFERMSPFALAVTLLDTFANPDRNGAALNILEEMDLSVDDYWDALDHLDRIKTQDDPEILPQHQFILGIAVSDILGCGFGQVDRVEAHAKSLGYGPRDLREALESFGAKCGADGVW